MRWRVWIAALASALLLAACQGSPAAPVRLLAMGHYVRETRAPVVSSPAVADLDGNGTVEVAVGSLDGYLYLLDARLTTLPGWPKYSAGGFHGSPAVTDLDGDGELEVLASAEAGTLYAWNSDGSAVPGWPVELGYRSWASPTVLRDGNVAIGGLRKLMVFAPDGSAATGWPQAQSGWASATVAAAPDLLAVTTIATGRETGGSLCAWHVDGTPYDW